MLDPTLQKILDDETIRQSETLDLIASENFTSNAVRDAVGSVFMHKYSEGYPDARYYEGNENIDKLEKLCIKMVLKVFRAPDTWSANVQSYSGSNANLAVYNALLEPGDTILSMYLPDGGHLSHGWSYTPKSETLEKSLVNDSETYLGGTRKVSIVSKFFNVIQYKTDPDTNLINYDHLQKLAEEHSPKIIVTGGTAYPRDIDYKKVKAIAESVGAYYLADVAHEAGLIAGQALDSPVGVADVVTFTTHKVMRGPKGAIILSSLGLLEKINKSVFPGIQGGPHNGTIAAIAQSMIEADSEEFRSYAKNVILNSKALASELIRFGFELVSGGTDKHLILINLLNKGIGGKFLARALAVSGIIANMNTIPYETGSPLNPSGIRIGTPTLTTRGMGENEMIQVAQMINDVTNIVVNIYSEFKDFESFNVQLSQNSELSKIKDRVKELCKKFPFKNF
jgi:glycine hydroxymethyltransferase